MPLVATKRFSRDGRAQQDWNQVGDLRAHRAGAGQRREYAGVHQRRQQKGNVDREHERERAHRNAAGLVDATERGRQYTVAREREGDARGDGQRCLAGKEDGRGEQDGENDAADAPGGAVKHVDNGLRGKNDASF